MYVEPQDRYDLSACLAWVLILLFIVAFWTGVGIGIDKALGAVMPNHPRCTYSKVEMHATFGTASARCTTP